MKATARDLATLTLDERGLCDLELLAVGGYSPLTGFLGRADCERVVREQRLVDGTFWPVPITLPVEPGPGIEVGATLALRDVYGNLLAFQHVEELYALESESVGHCVAGRLEVLRTPPHLDFEDLRPTPAELRARFAALGWSKVLGFHTDGVLHRAQEERARRAALVVGGGLLIHPAVGMPRPGDVEHYTRVRCLRAVVEEQFAPESTVLGLLPLTRRPTGLREVLLHAIVRRNFGCSHLILEEELVADRSGANAPGEVTRAALRDHGPEIGIELIDTPPLVYVPASQQYVAADAVPAGVTTAHLTDAEVRDEFLARGRSLPEWFTRPAVAEILAESHPPRFRQGLTLWFTGLSGSGKSTVAHALVERLAEYGRNCSMLDGDEIRTHLSKGLGFSKEDRDTNIRRVGYVAGLVNRHGGTMLCSVISPYRAIRDEARAASRGNFVEVYCRAPLDVCEQRDVKGLYARARAAVAEGKPMGFTGVDDPYEPPLAPEVTIDTSQLPVAGCVDAIIETLLRLGYIRPRGHAG